MATVYGPLFRNPDSFEFRSTAFPQIVQANGSNYPVSGLAFDAASEEAAFVTFIARAYGSGNITVDVWWYADTATSGDVVWGAQIAAITPGTTGGTGDTQDIETDGLATQNTITDTHLGTTGQRLHLATITVSNLDSIAANDYVTLRIARTDLTGADTMTGDAILVALQPSYSDT